jgi:hypothetical protein
MYYECFASWRFSYVRRLFGIQPVPEPDVAPRIDATPWTARRPYSHRRNTRPQNCTCRQHALHFEEHTDFDFHGEQRSCL